MEPDEWAATKNRPKIPAILEKAKAIMVLETSRFCIIESQERKLLNSSEHAKNETVNKGPRKSLPLGMTERLQRGVPSSRETHHPFASTLLNGETQNLLRIKFLDCILSEAETSVIGGLHSNNAPKKSSSRSFKRGRRMVEFKQRSKRNPSTIRHSKKYLRKYEREKRFTKASKKVKQKPTRFERHLKESTVTTENFLDPHQIVEKYNSQYRKEIMASKKKNFGVFCEDNKFDLTSSSSQNINQTWENILSSLEKYMEKVIS